MKGHKVDKPFRRWQLQVTETLTLGLGFRERSPNADSKRCGFSASGGVILQQLNAVRGQTCTLWHVCEGNET